MNSTATRSKVLKSNSIFNAIMTICSMSIASINNTSNRILSCVNNRIRPRVSVKINGQMEEWLYDTGASRTCLGVTKFRQLFSPDQRKKLPTQFSNEKMYDAAGNDLGCRGLFEVQMQIFNKTFTHQIMVLEKLKDNIIGIDLMHAQGLSYDTKRKQIFFQSQDEKVWQKAVMSVNTETIIPACSVQMVTVNVYNEFATKQLKEEVAIATVAPPKWKQLTGGPALVTIDKNNQTRIMLSNCAPWDATIPRGEPIGFIDKQFINTPTEVTKAYLNAIAEKKVDYVNELTDKEILKIANLNVPEQFKQSYRDLLLKHKQVFSNSKTDLGRVENFYHKIHIKDNNPVYRKQFKIPDAHQKFLQDSVNDWLTLGIVQRTNSLYNSPMFCVPKKDGGLRIVQDFRELNEKSHMDKYSMKEINECIGEIGRAGSNIFTTLDLTAGFWQMPVDPRHRKYTAFTIPGLGQFEWITSPMGLLGCPASFQRLMEAIMRGIDRVIVYIDDLLIHTDSHEEHLKILDETFQRLRQAKVKLNLNKCIFGNTEVSYLGFTLTPEGIRPGKNKTKAIAEQKAPKDLKGIRSFIGLCNFFRTHIRNFATISAPLTKLTRKDSGWTKGDLPEEAQKAFSRLKLCLTSDPVIDYPRRNRQYALIVDAATGTQTSEGGIGAILTQIDENKKFRVISYGSRQLKPHEANYSPFLLEMQAVVWGMEFYQEYLRGKEFIVYSDHKPLEKLNHLHTKTMNRLQLLMLDYNFIIKYHKGEEMPADFLSRSVINELSQQPFERDLFTAQKLDPDVQMIAKYLNQGKFDHLLPQKKKAYWESVANRVFLDDGIMWLRIPDSTNGVKNAIWLPKSFRHQIICAAHDNLLSGHESVTKTIERIQLSYTWPGMRKEIDYHIKSCTNCQFKKKATKDPNILKQLPQCNEPNQRIHVDLFGPLKSSPNGNKYILCMTDAFTKYAEVIALPNKEAITTAEAIFVHWICRFGVPVQIHSDGGKEFLNKVTEELYQLLQITGTHTSPAHPQCNAQVEIFNKTVAKYLSAYVNPSTLDWELYLPAMRFSYNTSYHSTTKTTPFQLTFGIKPRLPNLPNPETDRKRYGESFASERMELLQKWRQRALEISLNQREEQKYYHDRNASQHKFVIGQKVLLTENMFLNKNRKIAHQFSGPFTIIEINDTNAKIKTLKGKIKNFSVDRLKHFIERDDAVQIEKNLINENDAEEKENLIKFNLPNKQLINENSRITRSKAKQLEASINLINNRHAESLRPILMSAAYKLQSSLQLTSEEERVWKSLPDGERNLILTGDPFFHPDFRKTIVISFSNIQQNNPEQLDSETEDNSSPPSSRQNSTSSDSSQTPPTKRKPTKLKDLLRNFEPPVTRNQARLQHLDIQWPPLDPPRPARRQPSPPGSPSPPRIPSTSERSYLRPDSSSSGSQSPQPGPSSGRPRR